MAKAKGGARAESRKVTFGKRKGGSQKKILQQTHPKTESL